MLAISALIERERFAFVGNTYGLKYIAALMEPVFHIAIVVFWHWLVRVMPVYGTSKVLFISSGMFPIFIFIHLSHGFSGLYRLDGGIRRLPRVHLLDVIIAHSILKLTTYLLVGLILFAGIYQFVTPQALPFNPGAVVLSTLGLALLGIGMGMFNAAIAPIIPLWTYLWGPISRSLILFGGVLYVPDFLPVDMRWWLMWNPVLQGVELFRQGFYPQYPTFVFMPWLLVGSIGAALLLGTSMLRLSRKRFEKP